MFRRSTIVVVLFGLIIAAIIGYDRVVKNQPPLEITVAVDPLAENWIRKAAEQFNNTETFVNNGTTRVRVNISAVMNDVKVWTGTSGWTFDKHPQVWIASSSASLQYIPSNLTFVSLKPSLARTPLLWGGFQSRVAVITDDGQKPFDWSAVNTALKAGTWAAAGASDIRGNVNMAINWPESSMAGMAVLFSGVADLNATDTLSRSVISSATFATWLEPFSAGVRNSERIGESPAQAMASRGTSVADFALLPEAQWILSLNDLVRQEAVVLNYPAYQFMLDFPMAIWNDQNTTDIQRQAAMAFGDYLLSPAGQQLAMSFGLRPAAGEPDGTAMLFTTAVQYGIQPEPDYGQLVNIPARNEADVLLRALD